LEQIVQELEADRKRGIEMTPAFLRVLTAYHGEGRTFKLERNDFIGVTSTRMKHLVANAEFPIAGTFQYGPHIGVLLNMESDRDPKEFSVELAHEIGHFERMKQKKADIDEDPKKARLEEGIVQANAKRVAVIGGFADATAMNGYEFETWVAEALSQKLGVLLMDHTHSEIRQIMARQGRWPGMLPDPYQYLVDNLDGYSKTVEEASRAGEDIGEARLRELALKFNQAKTNLEKMLE
jgi:hypothetical protein